MKYDHDEDGNLTRIHVAREVHEAAQALRALDGVRGLVDWGYAATIRSWHLAEAARIRKADPDDTHWVPIEEAEATFWQEVYEFMRTWEDVEPNVTLNILDE